MREVQAIAAQAQADALLGYGEGEPDLFVRAAPLQVPVTAAPDANWGAGQWCLSPKGAKDLLGMLLNLPSGVLQPSLTIPGTVARCCSRAAGVVAWGHRLPNAWPRHTCMPPMQASSVPGSSAELPP